MLSAKDRNRLRDLAKRVKEAADSPAETEKRERIKRLNSLERVRPPVFLGFTGEMMEGFLPFDKTVSIESDPLFKGVEYWLCWRIFRSAELGDDMPVSDVFHTPVDFSVSDWMDGYSRVLMNADKTSRRFEPCLKEFSDFKRMRKPILTVNWKSSDEAYEKVCDAIGDILRIVKGSPFFQTVGWGESIIDQFAEMRGLEQLYYDMVDNPGFVHEVMAFMTDAKLELLSEYKRQGLFVMNNGDNHIGSSSVAYTDELEPLPGEAVIEKNLWGFAHAQELSDVSPAMLEEFVLPYQARIINRFGLSLYGCCEPNEDKIGVISKYIHNLRMVSISPFVNHEKAAEVIGGRYVYAWKQHPGLIASFDPQAIENDLRRTLDITRGCRVAILMLDAFEYGNDLTRFAKWIDIAKRVAAEY